ncbi:MAG: IclR family transcriptional regulator [Novosphingobium sp.]|nr:IclR family transcriptional regulator [Novosphingobium sp.]MCP5403690.1 IclR family transcriptional regulator [Novosphingobium sp.]
MAVKTSQSGARMLSVFEIIAAEQPIGASAVARLLEEDRSAIQRAIVTLANAGWIAPTAERQVRWELSAKLFSLANLPRSSDDLRRRARAVLEHLRDETGETAFLAAPDREGFVVAEVAESRHVLRMAPRVGEPIPASQRATSRAVLPYYDPSRQTALLGRSPTRGELADFAASRERGYGVSVGEGHEGATTIAAPVLDHRDQPLAALGITGPSDRLSADRHNTIGRMLAQCADRLSRGAMVPAPA